MKRDDYLNEYYKTLDEAPLEVLVEYEDEVLAAIDDYKAAGDEKKVKELENDLKKVRELISKKRGK